MSDADDMGHSAQGPAASTRAGLEQRLRKLTDRRLWVAVVAATALVLASVLLWQLWPRPEPVPPQPAPTPEPTLEVDPARRLTWAPPQLRNPQTILVTDDNRSLNLEAGKDYVLQMPDEPLSGRGGLSVTGGRNVILIGGEIRGPERAREGLDRRGLYLKEQTGTVHIEGLKMTGQLSEGINLAQPDGATVQLQNIVIDLVEGSRDGHHADLVQTWAGPRRLRIDGLTGTSDYQAMFLQPNEFLDGPEPEEFDFRRMRLSGAEGHGYMLWGPDDADWRTTTDVQVRLTNDRGRDRTFQPERLWEDVSVVQDFSVQMPAGEPGIGYQSPGYRQS